MKSSRWLAGRMGLLSWRATASLLLLTAAEGLLPAQAPQPEQKAPASAAVTPDTSPFAMETLRASAERAYGDALGHGAWRIQGKARLHSADQTYEMIFDDRNRFLIRTSGALPQTQAFDGSTYWTLSPSSVAHRVVLLDRDETRMLAWTITGAWTAKHAPVVRTLTTASPGELDITLKPKDGDVQATLSLDPTTFETKALRYWTDNGIETWTFTEYRSFSGHKLPTHILHTSGQQKDDITFASLDKIEATAADFRMPKPKVDPTEYDAAASDRIEVKHIAGLMFVRPKVNGEELGWFFLDTGADVMCIDPSVVKNQNLPVVGSDDVAGVVGVSHLRICRAGTLQLGPVKIQDPIFLELDMAPFAQAFKLPIVGICGYDFLARASLDIDPKADSIRIGKPGAIALPEGAKWTRIRFHANTPCFECAFAANEKGLFSLDTGSNSTVDFFSPAVEKYHLLENRQTQKAQTGGAGGNAESLTGSIAWFDLGSIRIENPRVGFQLTKIGAFSSPYLVGNIGMGFMGKYRLVLDYQNERVAFVEKVVKQE
ncbi:MAG TPA: aspartyl protease family protein [Chthonomonadaceae bacterium]|nr:aspartyl protease family protein [Chthonomonadaceae bacterium]